MIRIILCEGKTDAVLLSYYLSRTVGWEYNKANKAFKIKLKNEENQYVGYYKKDEEELLICGVGGKTNFANFYRDYIEPYMMSGQNEDNSYRLAIVVDRDCDNDGDIERTLSDDLGECITEVKNGRWIENSFNDSFEQQAKVDVLCIIIPVSQQGALETLLMDALSEDGYRGNLISRSKCFVDNISDEAKEIIHSERLKMKTKLGVSLAVLYPEKVFSLIDEQLKYIEWDKSETLNECFSELIKI